MYENQGLHEIQKMAYLLEIFQFEELKIRKMWKILKTTNYSIVYHR